MLGYAQPQKLVVKTDTDTSEWRYWALDGKQLPFYSLATPVSDEGGRTVVLELPGEGIVYKIAGKGMNALVYASIGGVDTLCLYRDSLSFTGKNRLYNQYLAEAGKSDEYCRSFSYTRNHPLAKIKSLTEFKGIVAGRKAADSCLLRKSLSDEKFIRQQQHWIELRYKSLFLKKMVSLYGSPECLDEWIEAFKMMDFDMENPLSCQSEFFRNVMYNAVCIKAFMVDKMNPREIGEDAIKTFLFRQYSRLLSGSNLEYILACLLYDDIFQEEYSKDIPSLYDEYVSLFPNSSYIDILAPGVEKVAELYNQKQDNDRIRILQYDKEPEDFADMMRPFAGKVVYIDVWATTCGPCIQSFAHVEAMRKQLPDSDDIVFLYLSVDRDERHEKWNQMIYYYHLEGYHYRANRHTSKIIYSTFGNANGLLSIPHNAIVGKDGKIAVLHAASPAEPAKLKEQLQTLLK